MDGATQTPTPRPSTRRPWLAGAAATLGVLLVASAVGWARDAAAPTPRRPRPPLPARLSETGLYLPGSHVVDPRNLAYVPQYPLWTDGAQKRRYVRLPEGRRIDARDPDHFELPVGTRLWKEFGFGRPVETRYMERGEDGWRFATYVWRADGSDADLAPAAGVRHAAAIRPGVFHDVPGHDDCLACHGGRAGAVLGFNALQLSPARDPRAPHAEDKPGDAVDLADLARRGLIENLPPALLATPPRIAGASATERAARGYLFGNCAGCHNAEGPLAELGLDFDVSVARAGDSRIAQSAIGRPSGFRPPHGGAALRIAPGAPDASVVALRMGTRDPAAQMPPLGTRLVDDEGLALVRAYIASLPRDSAARKEDP